jgi:hypothetical protein
MNFTALYEVVVLALATAAISVTISKAQVFSSFRDWVADNNAWLGDLISCHYCTSHWVAMGFIVIYHPFLVRKWIVSDLFVSLFATVAISALVSGLILKLTTMKSGTHEATNTWRESDDSKV